MIRLSAIRFAAAAAVLCLAAGCKREQVRVYVAPKDLPAGPTQTGEPNAQIAWRVPEGWREGPSSDVNFASFLITGEGGEATVTISQLPNLQGRESLVINMWREQVGQPPMTEEEAAKAFTPTTVAGAEGHVFEVAGSREGKALRIVTASLHRPEGSWFFKLSGDEPVVLAEKEKFLAFIAEIKFVEGEEAAAAAGARTSAAPTAAAGDGAPAEAQAPQFKWDVPENWKTLAPGAMQVAKFTVPEQNGAKAEVAVSIFPSDTGGNLANINRWRAQLGLGSIDEAALPQHLKPLEGVPDAALVEITNEQRQIVGAIVPRDGRWWFYKMMGDAPAVTAAREDFVRFAQSSP